MAWYVVDAKNIETGEVVHVESFGEYEIPNSEQTACDTAWEILNNHIGYEADEDEWDVTYGEAYSGL